MINILCAGVLLNRSFDNRLKPVELVQPVYNRNVALAYTMS